MGLSSLVVRHRSIYVSVQISDWLMSRLTPKQFRTLIMVQLRHSRLFLFSILASRGPYFASATCYWPDATTAVNTYVRCNNTEDGSHSACCGFADTCSTRGFCLGSTGFLYRGGCTTPDWSSSNCAALCLHGRDNYQKIFSA